MSLFDRFQSAVGDFLVGGFVKARGGFGSGADMLKAIAESGKWEPPSMEVFSNQQKAYRAVSWVYVAVGRIAKGVALQPFELVKAKGEEDDEVERIYTHPMIDLLNRPNEEMTRYELIEGTVGFLLLTGNAYWFLSGSAGKPQRIQLLRSDRVKVVPDETGKGLVKGYVYEVGTKKIPLDEVEVVHFKLFHPANDYYGLSPLEAAAVAAEADVAAASWNAKFFRKDRATPSGMVVVKSMVSPTDFNRIKEEWKESYGGSERKTAFVRGSDIEWKEMGLTHKEMDFIQSRRLTRQEIFDIYDVPAGATDPNSTEANSVSGLNYFKEFTVWPICIRLGEKLTEEMVPFFGKGMKIQFQDIRPIDRQLDMKAEENSRAVRTFNEARALAGLAPVDDIDGRGIGELPFPVVQRATLSELLGPHPAAVSAAAEGGGSGLKDGNTARGEDPQRKRPSRAADVDDNPANKPKKMRKGDAEKPEMAKTVLTNLDVLLVPTGEYKEEMDRFHAFAVKRIERGRFNRDFESDIIPVVALRRLNTALKAVKSITEVDELFAQAAFTMEAAALKYAEDENDQPRSP